MKKEWNKNIKMELNHRDIKIFKAALPDFIKKLKKSSKIETAAFGTSAFSETVEYCEHLQRCIECALNPIEMRAME